MNGSWLLRLGAIVVFLVFAVGATTAARALSLRVHPENPHYFQNVTTGEPVIITSYSSIVPTALDFDYVSGISQLVSMRIEYSRVWHFLPWSGSNAIWPWARSATAGAPMGGNKIDMGAWNPSYWSRMRDAMSRAAAGGIIAEIHLFDRCGLSPGGSDRYQANPWAADNNVNNLETPLASSDGTPEFYHYSSKPNLRAQQERYIRKMIDETIAYPNIIYEIENEHWDSSDPAWVAYYSQFVKSHISANYSGSPRLVSYSSLVDDNMAMFSLPSVDIVNQHFGGVSADSGELNAFLEGNWSRNKAMNIDEFGNGCGDSGALSRMCWTIVTSGGNFHIEDANAVASYAVVENIRSFKALSGWDFIHAAPNRSLIASGNGYCMAQPGVEYVCYFPWGGAKMVNLAAGAYRVQWWHPLTGGFYQPTTMVHGGGIRSLTAPDSGPWVAHITARAEPATALNCKAAGSITVDGSPSDWALGSLAGEVRGGGVGTGDIALIGFDASGAFCRGACATTIEYPPANAADHTVKVYSKHDASFLYLLARVQDSSVQHPYSASTNYLNDGVEFLLDPGHDGGESSLSGSTSDAALVIDAGNQKNVYACASTYAAQVLGGVVSAVSKDSSGYWLEVRIAKTALSPVIPQSGTIGIDFCVRDNDGGDYASSLYTWHDPCHATVPSRVSNRWADLALSTVIPDSTPPANIQSFSAAGGAGQITLNWTNPTAADYTGVTILYKTTGFPTGPSDGTLLVERSALPGTMDAYLHTGVTQGVTYFYRAFAHDGVPNYAGGVNASAAPTATITSPTIIARRAGAITIDGATSDWNLTELTTKVRGGQMVTGDCAVVGYDGGSLYYGGWWTDGVLPTSAADHTARIYARHDQDYLYLLVRCDDSDVRFSGSVGANWVNDSIEIHLDPGHNHGAGAIASSTSDVQLIIDANNQKNSYLCSAAYATQVLAGVSSAVARDASGWWLEMRVAKDALSPGLPDIGCVGLDFSFRDNDANNDPAYTTLYGWCDSTASGGYPSRVPDKWGDILLTDITPPSPVTGLTVIAGDGENHLVWTNPADADLAGVRIVCKTGGYPQSASHGTVIYSGLAGSCRHTGLVNGTTYYYCAYAYDAIPNYSSPAQAVGTPIHLCPAEARSVPDATLITLTSGIVSAAFNGFFYVQSGAAEAPAGIRVVRAGHSVSVGQKVSARGVLQVDTLAGERCLYADTVIITSQ